MRRPKYTKDNIKNGDIVGVISDRMYEFRITSYSEKLKAFRAKCTNSYNPKVKVGKLFQIQPSQIFIRLGAKGKKFPLPKVKE